MDKDISVFPGLPERCYGTLQSTGEIIIIKRGETGYYKTDVDMGSKDANKALADEYNEKLGVSKVQAAAMSAGSMFGWDVPGADPNGYDEQGCAKMKEGQTLFSFCPASIEEQMLCYTTEAPVDNACIGHLRGDFDRDGTSFYTTWWPHQNDLKTDLFVRELDDVINGLRKNGPLKDLKNMIQICGEYPDASIRNCYRQESAFRITTDQHLFFLRCIPYRGDYNFYCYVYNREMLREIRHMEKEQPVQPERSPKKKKERQEER